ncbi:MAG: hypothetical protein ACFFAO_06690 [Candidatus Hermodarchaeota archaeon]
MPNKDNAPTKEDNNIGLISESKITSNKYSPETLHITSPLI